MLKTFLKSIVKDLFSEYFDSYKKKAIIHNDFVHRTETLIVSYCIKYL